MSSSEEYFKGLVAEQRGMDWGAAVRAAGQIFGKHANTVLSGVTGRTHKSAERWTAKATDKINPKTGLPSQSATPKPMDQVKIVDFMKRALAAQKVRNSSTAHAGSVEVKYPDLGRDEGTRNIGDVDIDAEDLKAVAEAVERGDFETAGELMDAAVLEAYGVPEGVLEIEDYGDGFSLS